MEAAGAAEVDRLLVADQTTAAVSEDGRRLVKHARYYWLLLAEGNLTRRVFGGMLRWIRALPVPAGRARVPLPNAKTWREKERGPRRV